jgi:MoaA/NifB/PqqE/SkfB family radical SAM enzyme
MDYRDVTKIVKGVLHTPTLPYYLFVNAARYSFHPLERHMLAGWSLPPRTITIMITDRCNLRCRMCHFSYSESPAYSLNRAGFMPIDLFKRILDTCPGKPMISLTGGEPLLHPEVLDFIRECKRRGFFCSLTTNGSFLQAKAAQLCESKLDLLVVSIDGDQETHDQIRTQGAFQKAVSGIQEILKQSDRPIVGISTVIMDTNYHELGKSLRLAEGLGVDLINFNHLWIQTDQMILEQEKQPDLPQSGRIQWKVDATNIDGNGVYESLQAIHKQNHHVLVHEYPELNREQARVYYAQPEQLVKVRTSRCAWQTLKIYPDGEVAICRENHAGNVQDQPLREIWNNQKFRNFRQYLSQKGTCPICSRCCLVFSRI